MSDETPSLASVFCADTILIHPESANRADVVRQLMTVFVESGQITRPQATAATRLVNDRESVGSTAIGGGVALPHARVGYLDSVLGAFALLQDGEGFNALDGAPVRFVFLLLTPKDDDALHINTLKAITRFAGVPIHLKALAGCESATEVISVFKDYA